ncbi:uncharacterized protein LOC110714556 [Chenopodium quinoa]|uniref:uncharacterized protein LOC110714556 n=1 Tax=Chenopodium quinoa TaxID=63459 RepID=UPI000B76CDE0|nr:uncharacterized protein LOC110714556 [Chenopodium quinoa]
MVTSSTSIIGVVDIPKLESSNGAGFDEALPMDCTPSSSPPYLDILVTDSLSSRHCASVRSFAKKAKNVVFLMETMLPVHSVAQKLASLSFSGSCGIDAVGLSGGLFVFWLAPLGLVPMFISQNVILCKYVMSDVTKYYMLVYGAPYISNRLEVWNTISELIDAYPNVILLGDFNQVEYLSDKVGGNALIPGQLDFTQWRLDSDLVDIPFLGPQFTWTNNKIDSDSILERLDRAYATPSWLTDHSDATVLHQPILFSDHAAIIFRDSIEDTGVQRPYRIENWCLSTKDVHSIVDSVVSIVVVGSPMFSLSRRLSFIRDRLLAWCTSHKRLWDIDWKSLALSIGQAASSLHTRIDQQKELLIPFSALQIKEAMFGIDDNKPPGPDGFFSAFFKVHWSLVNPFVVGVVQYFLTHGYMLKEWNRTFLTLLPKVDSPELVSQFRPISLCNVLYKCIAKCITGRLRPLLPSLVSDYQNAFAPGRLTSDYALIAHDVFSFMNALRVKK